MPTKTHYSRRRGSALISALFIMTLVAIAATAMSTRLQLDIYRTRLTLITDKLYLASQYVSFWAMSELNHRKIPFPKIDNEGAILTFPPALQNSYPELQTTGKLYDLQGKINLNNLTDKNYYRVFLNLLEITLPDMNKKDREAIALATQFWISPYKPGRGNDQLVNAYLKQNPPYYQSGQLMQNVSEFRLINGVSAKTYRLLEPYITALPDVTPINIDTASKTVLMSLGNGLTEEQVNQLLMLREEEDPLNKPKALSKLLSKLDIRSESVTTDSQYFLSQGRVAHEDVSLINYSVFRRENRKGVILVKLISESLNTL